MPYERLLAVDGRARLERLRGAQHQRQDDVRAPSRVRSVARPDCSRTPTRSPVPCSRLREPDAHRAGATAREYASRTPWVRRGAPRRTAVTATSTRSRTPRPAAIAKTGVRAASVIATRPPHLGRGGMSLGSVASASLRMQSWPRSTSFSRSLPSPSKTPRPHNYGANRRAGPDERIVSRIVAGVGCEFLTNQRG